VGLFWDLIQQSQISQQREHGATLDRRVEWLERELNDTRQLLQVLLRRLETQLGEDLDRDGRVG
jgi:hypothetical protein